MVNPSTDEPGQKVMTTEIDPWEFYEKHFSRPRMKHYLDECGNDQDRAKKLYVWNTKISAAFLELLSYLEVALRNCINERMVLRHQAKSESGNWTEDQSKELGRNSFRNQNDKWGHKHPYSDINQAIFRVRKNNKPITTEQIISELPFGFWIAMVSKKQQFLWPDLAAGFPNTPNRNRGNVADLLMSIKSFRNRISHHHRIWNLDLDVKLNEIYRMSDFINSDLSLWIKNMSRVEHLNERKP